MKIEQRIEQLLSKHPEISKEEIAERLKKEKHRTNGFISEGTLLRMIAAEMGIDTHDGDFKTPTLSVEDLVPSLGDVTVVGRVVAVFSPKAFNGSRKGKFASLLIADESGIVRVVAWNEKANLAESCGVKAGQIIRISHGYTKEGRGGKVEVHVGEKCRVERAPSDVEPRNYPTLSKFATKIGKIAHDHRIRKVSLIGTVKKPSSASTFKREDSSSGKVMRFTLADETGEIPVVAWNEKVDELQTILKENAGLQIVEAKVKGTMERGLELHIGSGTYLGAFVPEEEFLKIASLKEGMTHINLEGEVITKPLPREVKTFKQEIVNLVSFELKDKTGRIWVSAWRNHAKAASSLKVGDKIVLRNAYVKKGFGDKLEISTRENTFLNVISQTGIC
jgi:ssDNA-binding replication factor A large subunit